MPRIALSLVQLFEAIEKELAAALDARQWLTAAGADYSMLRRAELTEQRLRRAAATLEAALDKNEPGTIH